MTGIELLVLVDNAAEAPLRREHGLSVLVSGPGRTVLFDAAATEQALLQNASCLGVDLAAIDSAVISHGHYDHTGGLAAMVARRRGLSLYANPLAFNRRWADRPGQPLKDVSCPHSRQCLTDCGAVIHPVEAPEMLENWMVLSGPIGGPREGKERFVIRKADDMVIDAFADEIVMLLRGPGGWAVLTGCCHRGLRNTLRQASFLARREPVVAVVGGLHLREADQAELARTAEVLRGFGSPALYPCHCTGENAVAYLAEKFAGKVHPLRAGMRIML